MTTYQYQSQLQKLPIPDLKETCANYLSVLKPLQNEKEHEKTIDAVQKFLKSGTGEYLDSELRKYAENRNSYIEQFWYDSYLNYDSPVVLNLNPFFLLEDDPFNNESTTVDLQIKRAASLTISSLKFIRALKNETLSVDEQRNGKPLCMYQYSKLFGASRIPTDDGCIMQSDPKSNHIIVMSKSQFYWFDVLDHDNNLIMSEQDMIINFSSIIRDSRKTPINEIAKSSFGVLTTENRRVWAKIRNSPTIANNTTNKEILFIIDSALFVICLDDIVLTDLSELSKNMLCGLTILDRGVQVGTCTNRWYDKLQIIVTQNGKAGINFEHTGVDGHTVLRFVSDIYTDSILSFARSINSNAPSLWGNELLNNNFESSFLVTKPRKLEWDLTPDLSLALRFGETRISDLMNQNEFKNLEFKSYGSATIKKMKYSPDAFVQMAFQASYYALYGKVECTYEPAMVKSFFHGRTESIRTVSQESNFFVRKFFDPAMPAKAKLKYLADACEKHTEQTKRCLQGKGVDRHLFALFCIWKRYMAGAETGALQEVDMRPDDTSTTTKMCCSGSDKTIGGNNQDTPDLELSSLPEIFADAGWDKLSNTIISTSNCGNPSLRLFGFGPVSPNGFGIGYIIRDDSISICASSKHRQTERFLLTLESYLIEIYRMFKEVNESAVVVAPMDIKKSIDGPVVSKSIKRPVPTNPKANVLNTLLGGHGYFDMGEDEIKSRGQTPEPPFLSRTSSNFSIREIEKKLRLSEY